MLTMFPRDLMSAGSAPLQQRKTLVRFPSSVVRHCSSVHSATLVRVGNTPALLTRTSRRSNAWRVASTSRHTSAATVTSAGTGRARPPARSIASPTAVIGPGRRPFTTTLAPSRANSVAMLRPRPVPAPVTIATLSRRRIRGQPAFAASARLKRGNVISGLTRS